MKIAYLDCFSGIAGDMFLGALIDAGLKLSDLKNELNKLGLKGYSISAKTVNKKGLSGTKFDVKFKEGKTRHYSEIVKLIDKSKLDKEVKELSKKIFYVLGKAEAKIHNTKLEKVHFHEVGAVDSIIDIVGAAIGVKKLEIERIYCSALPLGKGFVKFSHGKWPIPGPAAVEILKGKPVYQNKTEKELVTPTGAAIAAVLCSGFGEMPRMKVGKIGYGAGSADLETPNMLRIFIGEKGDENTVDVIETNIDDMNPEFYDYVIERLFKEGALDVYLENILMKKNRPGIKLSVISPIDKTDKLTKIIFEETTTLGVRINNKSRKVLEREIKTVKTKYGKVKVKLGKLNNKVVNIMPEYEDCKRIAKKNKIALKKIYDLAKKELL